MGLREELIQVAAVAVAAVQDIDIGHTSSPRGITGWRMDTEDIINDIRAERERQEDKWGPQHHTPEEWMAILAEEVGEAAQDIYANSVGEDLSSYAEFNMVNALFDAEMFARAFLKERFGDDPSN
jgi:NTP pyrophosphatase (non-canonical NTP hydrolase)